MVKAARRHLAVDVIGLAGESAAIVKLVADSHLDVERTLTRHVSAQHALDFEPILAVVLLEDSAQAEGAHGGAPDRIFNFGRRVALDESPRPDFQFARSPRMPYAHRADSRQAGKIREHRQMAFDLSAAAYFAEEANSLLAHRACVIFERKIVRAIEKEWLLLISEKPGAMSIGGTELPALPGGTQHSASVDLHPFRRHRHQRRCMADVRMVH